MIEKICSEFRSWIESLLMQIPGGCGARIRFAYYRNRFITCGKNIFIPPSCIFRGCGNIKLGDAIGFGLNSQIYACGTGNESIEIGSRVHINSNVMINADHGGKICIGNNVLIGPNVVIRASNHKFDNKNIAISLQGHTGGKIEIGDDVWIGANVVILPDVRIGRGAIIGAGAVVTRDIRPWTIALGSPAKESGNR